MSADLGLAPAKLLEDSTGGCPPSESDSDASPADVVEMKQIEDKIAKLKESLIVEETGNWN